jgi:transposase-like protein
MKNKDLSSQKSPCFGDKKKKYKQYSYALKRKVVYELETGRRSIEQARLHYEIKGKTVIYSWIKKYGLLHYNPKKEYLMKQSPQEKIKELQLKIEELELEKDILLDIQQIYEEEFGVPVKKYLPWRLEKDLKKHLKKG